jgi:hypothetical protein
MVNRLISKAHPGHLSTTYRCAKIFQFVGAAKLYKVPNIAPDSGSYSRRGYGCKRYFPLYSYMVKRRSGNFEDTDTCLRKNVDQIFAKIVYGEKKGAFLKLFYYGPFCLQFFLSFAAQLPAWQSIIPSVKICPK